VRNLRNRKSTESITFISEMECKWRKRENLSKESSLVLVSSDLFPLYFFILNSSSLFPTHQQFSI
jgi:hypothetical protein